MVPINVEKIPAERLIALDEVPTSVIPSNPFENRNDVFLQGDISAVAKGGVLFRSKRLKFETDDFTQKMVRDSLVENARRDLAKSPSNPFLLNNLGLAYLGVEELEKAKETFSAVLKEKPDMLEAALNLATVHTIENEDEKARAIYEYLLKESPRDTRVLINLAGCYFKMKDLEKTKTVLRELLQIDKKNIAARNNLAIVELIEGDARAAIQDLRVCLKYDGNLGVLYSNLGVAYAAVGSHSKAIEAFRVSLKLFPSSAGTVSNLAHEVRRAHGLKEAIDVLEDFAGANRSFVAPKELLAKFYIEDGSLQKAQRILGSLLFGSDKPDLPVAEAARLMNNLGVVFSLKGEWANAEKFYLSSIEKAGHINKTPVTNLIDLHFTLGNLNNARAFIRLLQLHFPDERLYLFYDALYEYRVHEVDKAITLLRDFLSDGNKSVPAYNLLGYLYSEYLHDYKRVVELLVKTFGRFPADLRVLNNLAYNYLMGDDIESARVLLANIEERSSGVFLIATKGLLEIKQGNIDKGRELYNRAAQLCSDRDFRTQVLLKKDLEVARFYNLNNRIADARSLLEKAMRIRTRDSVYAGQIEELLHSIH